MARKSTLWQVLETLSSRDLKDIARHRALSVGGSKDLLVARIVQDARRDLADLVSPKGSPLGRDDWNDVIEALGGYRKRSWDEVRSELEGCIQGRVRALHNALEDLGDLAIAQVRSDESLLAQCAQLLETTPRRLVNALQGYHGNTALASIWSDLIQHFRPGQGMAEEPVHSTEIASTIDAAPVSTRQLPLPSIGYALNNRWKVMRILGEGGFGTAFEVVDVRNPTRAPHVAKLAANNKAIESLTDEWHATVDLSHDNICRYVDLDTDDKFGRYLIMQHGGESLYSRYRALGASFEISRNLFAHAAAGLDYLHSRKRVHGDVSPSNILVGPGERVRLADFGISRQLITRYATDRLTRIADVRGLNDWFAAPEVRSNQLRRASDQYSLALSFRAVALGVDNFYDDVTQQVHGLSLRQQAALEKALHHRPSKRFDSCAMFISELFADS